MNKQEITSYIVKNTDIYALISQSITLKQNGRNSFVGLCPFHDDTNPSLSVSISKQIFKCFSCQKAGNIITFVMLSKNLNFGQALDFLNKEYNLKLDFNYTTTPEKIYSKNELQALRAFENAVSIYLIELMKVVSSQKQTVVSVINFLNSRGIDRKIIEKFKIGLAINSILRRVLLDSKLFDEDVLKNYSLLNANGYDFFQNRIVFPIENSEGKTVGFSGRCIDGLKCEPKYLNSPSNSLFQKSEILYNYFNAIQENPKEIIITEGFFDVIAFYKAGIKNTVALMGTTLSKKHCDLLKNFTVIIALDSDKAGIDASLKSALSLGQNRIKTYILKGFDGKDPDEYFNSFGPISLVDKLNDRKNSYDFAYDFYKSEMKNNSGEEIKIFLEKFSPFLEALYHYDLQLSDTFFKKIKDDFGVSQHSFKFFREKRQPYYQQDYELENNVDFLDNTHRKISDNKKSKNFKPEHFDLKILEIILYDFLYGDRKKFEYFKTTNYKFLDPINNKFIEKIAISNNNEPSIYDEVLKKIKEITEEMVSYIASEAIKVILDPNLKANITIDEFADFIENVKRRREQKDRVNKIRYWLENGKEMDDNFISNLCKGTR
ncbi:DNA primase [Mesomycoplasma dispar]|uniref:DNA primase n=1 Tax=Mesomycoplasma dispar TaxID=86660 RepID=A0AAJ5NPS9_9BACT|nr:DNA primase [Mesomycoplasma dispar]AJR11932.1 DNA primase [Mesomycoplasma dispar]VEU61202.1 DNA primase [Mesomycoplasma dispar]